MTQSKKKMQYDRKKAIRYFFGLKIFEAFVLFIVLYLIYGLGKFLHSINFIGMGEDEIIGIGGYLLLFVMGLVGILFLLIGVGLLCLLAILLAIPISHLIKANWRKAKRLARR